MNCFLRCYYPHSSSPRKCYPTEYDPMRFDDIEAFLANEYLLHDDYDGFQYVKPALNMVFRIPSPQAKHDTYPYRYCRYVYINSEGVMSVYYLFVRTSEWINDDCIELHCRLDILNTYQGRNKEIELAPELCHISRCHRDRYGKNKDGVIFPIIDLEPEGDSVEKVKRSEQKIEQSRSAYSPDFFFLVYSHSENTGRVELSISIQPPYNETTSGVAEFAAEIDGVWCQIDGGGKPLSEDTSRNNLNINLINRSSALVDRIIQIPYFPLPLGTYETPGGEELLDVTSIAIDADDLPQAGKGWHFVYKDVGGEAPETMKDGLEIVYYDTVFDSAGRSDVAPSTINDAKVRLESKFARSLPLAENFNLHGFDLTSDRLKAGYHSHREVFGVGVTDPKSYSSEYFLLKYVYGASTLEVPYERFSPMEFTASLRPGSYGSVTFWFSVNTGMTSAFMMDIETSTGFIREPDEDMPYVVLFKKSMEVPLYTSAYANYINSGAYSYDQQSLSLQMDAANWSIGSSVAGAVVSTGLSAALSPYSAPFTAAGNLVNIASGVAGAQRAKKQAQIAQDSKRHSLAHQRSSVSGSDDISLFTAYSDMKVYEMTYTPRADVWKAIDERFRTKGYAADEIGDPDDYLDSRQFYNYLEAEVIIAAAPQLLYFDDAIAKEAQFLYARGFTQMHPFKGTGQGFLVGGYDVNRTSANMEMTIVNGQAKDPLDYVNLTLQRRIHE